MERLVAVLFSLSCLMLVGHVPSQVDALPAVDTFPESRQDENTTEPILVPYGRINLPVDTDEDEEEPILVPYGDDAIPADWAIQVAEDIDLEGGGEERIIGGANANGPTAYPFAVVVRGNGLCGGTILSAVWILTAAHCVYDRVNNPGSIIVQAGSNDRAVLDAGQHPAINTAVRNVYVHQNYVHFGGYDIAMLRLASPLTAGPTINAARITRSIPVAGERLTTVGWGRVSVYSQSTSRYLKEAEMSVASGCNVGPGPNTPLNSIICMIDNDRTCNGDSGGFLGRPASGSNLAVQMGITSYGVQGCLEGYTAGFTTVSFFVDWILGIAAQYTN